MLEKHVFSLAYSTGRPCAGPISQESESREMKLNAYPAYDIEAYESRDDLTTIHFPHEQIST